MKRTILLIGLVLLISLMAVMPVFAHNAGPCNTSDDPGHSAYAKHHIVVLAQGGDVGAVDHDGDGVAHTPGTHHGYSACDPSGQ